MVPSTILQAFGASHWTQPSHWWPLLGLSWYMTELCAALALCARARVEEMPAMPAAATMAAAFFSAARRDCSFLSSIESCPFEVGDETVVTMTS